MRLPRMTMRRWMLAEVIVAVLLCLILRMAIVPATISLGVGHTAVHVSFVVSDADTGQPVEGASIQLRDHDLAEIPTIDLRGSCIVEVPGSVPPNIDLKTGRDGSASMSLDLQFVSSSDPSGRLLSFGVRYPPWHLRVYHEGYQEFTAPFAAYERGNLRFHDGYALPPRRPPPIVIRLPR